MPVLELQADDPWEGVAGLASPAWIEGWLGLLRARAPGARVLVWGPGAGTWGVVAAGLGARHVVVVDPTEDADAARELVAANRLAGRVEVREGMLGAQEPAPVDLALPARIGPEPFSEGIAGDLAAAARWVVPGGLLAPRRIRVWAATCEVTWTSEEAAAAREELDAWSRTYDLDFGPVRAALDTPLPYRQLTEVEDPTGEPVLVWDLGPGARPRPRIAALAGPESAGGVVLWTACELDEDRILGGPPGTGSPWPPLVCGFVDRLRLPARIRFTTAGGRIVASPVG